MNPTHILNTDVFSATDTLKAGARVFATPSVAEHGFVDLLSADGNVAILRVAATKVDPITIPERRPPWLRSPERGSLP